VGLWRDLSELQRVEFDALLDELYRKPTSTKRAAHAKPSQPKDDRPVTRIAHQLRERSSLADDIAMAKLTEALIARGVRREFIPNPTSKTLEAWLTSLIAQVSETRVMVAAKQIKN
jgi:hypothetical protein